ncbi:hypothetical protein J7L36_00800 [bacterium]|nr:hypothetical protein [bacterium]
MSVNFRKTFGWLLIFVGLFIIGWFLYTSFNIFTAKSELPSVFKLKEEVQQSYNFDFSGKDAGNGKIQEAMQDLIKEEINKSFPKEFLPRLFNLIAWSILSGIMIFGGAQISNLGIKLLRK